MSELEILAARFEADRGHLRQVAQRILGSAHEADDAVQEAWVRLSRSDTSEVDNLTGWLTTVVSRVCLDMLRSRQARREDPAELPVVAAETADPEQEAVLTDALGPALLLVLDTLGPRERLAFVLHDMFAVPFPEIAEIIGASPAVARQLASRARRRVQGSDPSDDNEQIGRKREIVDAFLAAARGGDFSTLLELLDPSVQLRADDAAVAMGVSALVNGPTDVAGVFNGRAKALRTALIDGLPGLVWALRGEPKVAFAFTIDEGGRVTGIEQIADPGTLTALAIEFL
jgi:RNA polymerase sigma factor (sigma-70 family)